MVSRDRRSPSGPAASDQSVVMQVRVPAHRLDQLMFFADRAGMLATAVVEDLVLDHLDRLDPNGDHLPVPSVQSPCGAVLASVTRLPVMPGMDDVDAPAHPATMASVTPLWSTVGTD